MSEWISCSHLPIEDAKSPVTSDQLVAVRFFYESRESAMDRGFHRDCDSLIWDQNSMYGPGRIKEYMIQD